MRIVGVGCKRGGRRGAFAAAVVQSSFGGINASFSLTCLKRCLLPAGVGRRISSVDELGLRKAARVW